MCFGPRLYKQVQGNTLTSPEKGPDLELMRTMGVDLRARGFGRRPLTSKEEEPLGTGGACFVI